MHYENIPYKFRGSVAVLMDLWVPEGKAPEKGRPVLLFFHGGGWEIGDKNAWIAARPIKDRCEAEGFVFGSVGYRHAGYGAHMPVPCADTADAVAYIARNAEKYGIDPEKIFLAGHSAGGHLALLTALSDLAFMEEDKEHKPSYRIRGTVGMAGPTSFNFDDYECNGCGKNCGEILFKTYAGDREIANPDYYVKKGVAPKVPLLLLQGDEDMYVPLGMIEDMGKTCKAADHPCEVRPIAGGNHMFAEPQSIRALEDSVQWMKEQLQ